MSMEPTPRRSLARTAMPIGAALALAVALSACQTTQTNLTSARALEPGEFEANVNGQANLNTSPIRQGIEAGGSVKSEIEKTPEDESVSEETLRRFLDFALASQFFRPSVTPEVGFRAGIAEAPLEGLEAGARYNGRTPKADVKLQYWASEDDRWAASVQTGVGYQSSPAPSAVEYLSLTEWKRLDVDLLAPVGFAFREIARLWVAPRFMYSRVWTSPKLDEFLRERLPPEVEQTRKQLFGDEDLYQVGMNFGGMVGYEFVYFAAEVTVTRLFFRPEVLGEKRNLDGYSVTPAAGLVVQF